MANYTYGGHKRHSGNGDEGGGGEGETPMLLPLKRLRLDDEAQNTSPLETKTESGDGFHMPLYHLAYPDSVEFPDDSDDNDNSLKEKTKEFEEEDDADADFILDTDEIPVADPSDNEGSDEEKDSIGILRFRARESDALSWREKRRRKRFESGFGNGREVRFVLPDEFNLKHLPSFVYDASTPSSKLFQKDTEHFNSNPLAMVLYVPRNQILPGATEPTQGGAIVDRSGSDDPGAEGMEVETQLEAMDMEM